MASSSDDSLGWVLFGLLALWVGYDKWWSADAKPLPPAPVYVPPDTFPEGPITELRDGSVWRMVWGDLKGPRTARLAWVRADHTKNKNRKESETLTLYTINCDTTAFRTLSVVDYDKKGEVVDSWGDGTFSKANEYPVPGSNIDLVVDAACLPRFDKLGSAAPSQPTEPPSGAEAPSR